MSITYKPANDVSYMHAKVELFNGSTGESLGEFSGSVIRDPHFQTEFEEIRSGVFGPYSFRTVPVRETLSLQLNIHQKVFRRDEDNDDFDPSGYWLH